jgi:hypothetical protein
MKLEFSRYNFFLKALKYYVMNICLVGDGLWHVDRRTDRQAERQTGGRTDRRTDRQTGRRTDRQTGGQADRQADRETGGRTDRHTDRRTDRQTDRLTDRQAGRQAGRQADRRTDRRQTDRRTDRQAEGRTDGQTDRRTDMTKVLVASSNCANALNNRFNTSNHTCRYVTFVKDQFYLRFTDAPVCHRWLRSYIRSNSLCLAHAEPPSSSSRHNTISSRF